MMKKMISIAMCFIALNSNLYAKVLGKVENRKTGERITLECNQKLCDHIFINYFDEDGKGEELRYISLAQDQGLTDLQGGELRRGSHYRGTLALFSLGGDSLISGLESGANATQINHNGSSSPAIAPIKAVTFLVAAPIGTGVAVASSALGIVVGVGESLFYLGRGSARAISDLFDRDARSLRKYRKIISGDELKASNKEFIEIKKLLLN